MELPEEFAQSMQRLLGDEYDAYLSSLEAPRQFGLRVNTNKISVEDFLAISPFHLTPIPWIENGFYYDGERDAPSRHPYYYAGLYYLQEPSAMTPANRLPISPGDRVLDVCAAPGGKATELGSRLKGEGLLMANDISQSRAKGLLKNLEVAGIGNMVVLCEEPGRLAECFPAYFDKILIDAPCSGEGMFRKDAKMIRAWREHGPDYFVRLQRQIIAQSANMLKPGGLLMYSTCTFNLDENEGVIQEFLLHHPDFSVVPISPYEGFRPGRPDLIGADDRLSDAVRIFPHHMQGEGHFLVLLHKEGAAGESQPVSCKQQGRGTKPVPKELADFLSDVDVHLDPARITWRGSKAYYLPEEDLDFSGLRVLRSGLYLGEHKTNRFEPSQAWAMTLSENAYEKVLQLSADDPRLIRYLKGETLDVSDQFDSGDKGWVLVCTDAYPLGFGKLSGGILKNKYLPGWRMVS